MLVGHAPGSDSRRAPLGLGRRLLFTAVVFVGFLALLEGALSLAPWVLVRLPHQRFAEDAELTLWCVGDSVTYGDGLNAGESWPDQLGAQLRERGVGAIDVRTEAAEGATIDILERATFLKHRTGRPVALLVMLGHNDFMRWGGGRRHGIRGQVRDNLGRDRSGGGLVNLRIARILRWAWGSWQREIPEGVFDEATTARFGSTLARVAQETGRSGGRVYLLTYLVVGTPSEGLDDYAARIIEATHEAQPLINDHLRALASAQGAGLIDVQRRLMPPATFSSDWFQDHIHPTAAGSAEVARAVREALTEDGVLPPRAL